MKLEKISLLHVFAIIISLFLFVSVGFFLGICKPKLGEVAQIKNEIEEQETKIMSAKSTIKRIPELQVRQTMLMNQIAAMVDKELDASKAIPLTILQASEFFQIMVNYLEGYAGVEVSGLAYSKNGITFSLGGASASGGGSPAPAAPAAAGGGSYDWSPTPLPLTISAKNFDSLRGYISYLNKFPLLLSVDKLSIVSSVGNVAQSGGNAGGVGTGSNYPLNITLPLTMYQIKKSGS
ncbi:MAG: hypothetical protein ACOX1G_00515 [bacterium]|jgi:hypothetical protein|nr:hypothetical protein [bacterium]